MLAPLKSVRAFAGLQNACAAAIGLLASIPVPAQSPSNDFARSGFAVYSGDFNSDGYIDILAKAKTRIVMIPLDDLVVPVPIASPVVSFVILSDSGGSYTVSTNVSSTMLTSSVWRADTHDLRIGDLLGNGFGGAVIEARNPGEPSFSVGVAEGVPRLIQVLTAAALGFDLGASGITSELGDLNGDGRTDLTIRRSGLVLQVLHANASGEFVANQEATLRAVWLGFKSHLDSGNPTAALAYISPERGAFYSGIFQALGAERLRTLSATWTDVRAISLRPNYAAFSIVDTFNGQRSVHILVFEKDGERWVLTTL
jgi:hypothetical protein